MSATPPISPRDSKASATPLGGHPVVRRVYERPPSLVPAWVRAATANRKKPVMDPQTGQVEMPRLEMELLPQRADPGALRRYRRLCSFAQTDLLPPTYPQLMAGPLHINMLTDPSFPLPAAGVVHLGNRIEQTRPLLAEEPVHFACHLRPARLTARGIEVQLVTQGTVHGEPVWRSVMTILSRALRDEEAAKAREKSRSQGQEAEEGPIGEAHRSLLIRVPEDMGRAYAALAGDYNPIHLHVATAKLFGFPRAIAHGMWTLARAVAECEDDLPRGPFFVDVRFNKPVFLPSQTLLDVRKIADGLDFSLSSRDASRLHLRGSIGSWIPGGSPS